MILNIYNFRDERVGEFGTPVFTQLGGDAVADQYKKSIAELNAKLERLGDSFPEQSAQLLMQSASLKDTVIYYIGTFYTENGSIELSDHPLLVCRLSEFF